MARVASYDAAELERLIGARGSVTINSENRALVQNWLCAQGFPSVWCKGRRVATLAKAYNRPAYLAKLLQLQRDGVLPSGDIPDGDEPAAAPEIPAAGVVAGEELWLCACGRYNHATAPDCRYCGGGRAVQPKEGGTPMIPDGGLFGAALAGENAVAEVPAPATPRVSASAGKREKAAAVLDLLAGLAGGELDEDRVIALIREHAPKPNDRVVERIVVKADGEERELPAEARHVVFDECLSWLLAEENVYLVGPAGTGKTHLGKQLASAIGKRFLPVPQALTKYEFSGFIDAGGSYRGTIVRDAIENGGLLMIDEIDSFAAAAVMFLNSVMANGYCAFPDGVIEKHPQFQVIAAANTYGHGATAEYVGRNPLDAASLDRFAYVVCDYDEKLERALYGDSDWTLWCHKVRHACRELKQRHIVSMRAIERGSRGLRQGLSWERVEAAALWRAMDSDTIAKVRNSAGPRP